MKKRVKIVGIITIIVLLILFAILWFPSKLNMWICSKVSWLEYYDYDINEQESE